jgi:hypothetical protein
MINFLGPKDLTMGSKASSSEGTQIRGVSSSRLGRSPPSYAAVVRGEVVSNGTHAKLRGSNKELRGLDLFPESWCRVVEDGRLAVNCFALEEQPHESTEKSTPLVCSMSESSSFDPLDKGLLHRRLGKKKMHVVYSARGPACLNSNLRTWTKMLLSFKLAMGRFAGSGSGLKQKGFWLGHFLPKIKIKALLQTETFEDAGPVSTIVLGCSLRPETTSPTDSGLIPSLSSSGGGPSCRKLVPARDVGMGLTEILSGTKFGVALGLSSSKSVLSHLPLDPAAVSITLPSPYVFLPLPTSELLPLTLDVPQAPARSTVGFGSYDAYVLLPSNLVGVGAGLTQPFFPFPSLSGAAELGEKIRSSLPALQSTKPFQRYYQKARDLKEGHSMKWNEELLADSMPASKTPIYFAKKEVAAVPPVKNFAGSVKKGFLWKGFLNPCPTAIAPTASREFKDVVMIGLHSPPGCRIIPSSVKGNGFSNLRNGLSGLILMER